MTPKKDEYMRGYGDGFKDGSAMLRRAWELGRNAFTPAGILADKDRTERSWARDFAAISKAEASL